jgi:cell division protein FtsN
MPEPERRHAARTRLEKFVYINIEPSNGGSVLNVSETGLCFRSIAPVHAENTIRFWFREHDRRIEVDGELAWTDETRKTVGLRFITMPAEAREQIRIWTTPNTTPLAADEIFGPSSPLRRAFPVAAASQLGTEAASNISEPPAVVPPRLRIPGVLRGFSGGLATGLLLAVVVAAPFLFHSHRRQFGESLIQLGERLAGHPHPQAQMEPVLPAPLSVLPVQRTVLSAPAQIPVPQPEKLEPTTPAPAAKLQPRNPETARPAATTSAAAASPALKAYAAPGTTAISSARPTISFSLPNTALPPASVILGKPRPTPKPEPDSPPVGRAENLRPETVSSTPGIYLEVGKFKDTSEAAKAREKLTQLGFHASVTTRNRLWKLSYYVLVGPYAGDKADAARKNLMSHGFKPLAFERGSRTLTLYGGCDTMSRLLRSGQIANSGATSVEDCLISWESYSNHAIVKFMQDSDVVATADGRWVNRGLRFEQDAFVYRKNDDGSRTLIEIQFAGMSQALVFDKSS